MPPDSSGSVGGVPRKCRKARAARSNGRAGLGTKEGPGPGALVLQERHDQGGTVLGQRTDRDSSEAGRVQASEQGGRQRSGVQRAGHTGGGAAGPLGGERQDG